MEKKKTKKKKRKTHVKCFAIEAKIYEDYR